MKIRGVVAPLAVILGLAALGAAVPASAAAPSTGAVAVSAAPANSGRLSAGTDLTIQVIVDNKTDADLAAGTTVVKVGDSTFTTRTSLANWIAGSGDTSLAARTIGSTPTSVIFAGQSASVTATVPAASVGFGAAGVYPVSVAVTSGSATVATSRTAVAWNPSGSNPVPIAIAVPLTVPPTGADTGFLTAKMLTTYTAPTGVLTRELNDLAATQVAIGIDPRIIASIRVLGKSAPQSAHDWLDRLAALPNDTFPLAWADADLTVALQAGLGAVPVVKPLDYAIDPKQFADTGTSTETPAPTPTPTGSPVIPTLPTSADLVKWNYTLPQLSWPAENSVSTGDLAKLSAGAYDSLILSSTNITRSVNHVPGGASIKIGSTSDVVSDAILSTYLREAVQSSSHIEWTAAMARLITAADQISLETPKGAPAMVATLDRNWINESLQLPHSLGDLYSQPWVSRASLTDVTRAPAETAKLDSKTEPAARTQRVAAMFTAESAEVRFSTIAADPEALTSNRRLIVLSLLSNEWAPTSAAWDKASGQFLTDSAKIVSSVQVVDSSSVLLLADQASLPITVSNELDQPVTVYITVRPQTTQLFVDKKHTRVELTLNGDEQRKTQIPVQSVSNGKVRVHVTLSAADGTPIGESKTVEINVQAGWETLGTLIFAALVVATFGFGIVRNILNRRKARSE